MRFAAALAFLTVPSLLLAGCGAPGPGGEVVAETDADPDAVVAPGLDGNVSDDLAGLEHLRFDAEDREASAILEGTFATGDGCIPLMALCDNTQRHDVTELITIGVPTQVSLLLGHDAAPGALVGQRLEVQGGWFTYMEESGDEGSDSLVAVVVLEPGGTLGVAVNVYLPSLFPPGEIHYTVDTRSVVRPDIMPKFLPIAVHLDDGQGLAVLGSGLQDFVVVPPDGSPRHHTAIPFRFNASAATGGAGRHVVILAGDGDLMLHGPPGTQLKALAVHQHLGEPRPAASGQDVSWEFTVPGVTLQVALAMGYVDTAGGWSVAAGHGNYQLAITREGAQLLAVTEAGCLTPCEFVPLSPTGSRDVFAGQYLDEKLGAGTYAGAARFETSNNMHVREIAYYVVP